MKIIMLGKNKGKIRTPEMKAAAAIKSTGRLHTEVSKKLMSEKRYARTIQPWTGKIHTSETKALQSVSKLDFWQKKKESNEVHACIHCGKTSISIGNIMRWHNEKCKNKDLS